MSYNVASRAGAKVPSIDIIVNAAASLGGLSCATLPGVAKDVLLRLHRPQARQVRQRDVAADSMSNKW